MVAPGNLLGNRSAKSVFGVWNTGLWTEAPEESGFETRVLPPCTSSDARGVHGGSRDCSHGSVSNEYCEGIDQEDISLFLPPLMLKKAFADNHLRDASSSPNRRAHEPCLTWSQTPVHKS